MIVEVLRNLRLNMSRWMRVGGRKKLINITFQKIILLLSLWSSTLEEIVGMSWQGKPSGFLSLFMRIRSRKVMGMMLKNASKFKKGSKKSNKNWREEKCLRTIVTRSTNSKFSTWWPNTPKKRKKYLTYWLWWTWLCIRLTRRRSEGRQN